MWRTGKTRAASRTVLAEDLRNDMLRWRQMLNARPAKKLHYGAEGGFARHPRLPELRE